MKIKILSKSKNAIKFEIVDTNPVFANTLRRIILNRVSVLAVDKVRITKNSSALYNEVLAHRIGLVPLAFELGAYSLLGECTCKGKGCAKCQVSLVLKKKGPANVYAKDFKSTDPVVKPADGEILIAKLLKNQEIDLEAVARLGTGREHARWQPAIVGYQLYPTLKLLKKANFKQCVKKCPKHALAYSKGKLKLADVYACDLCQACVKVVGKGALAVEGDTSRIIMTVESISGLTPQQIVSQAAKIAGAELETLRKRV